MTKWKICALGAVVVAAAGFGYIESSYGDIPSDLRDAVADNGKFDTSIPVFDKTGGNKPLSIPVPKAADAASQVKYTAMTDQDFANSVMLLPKDFMIVSGGGFVRLIPKTPMSKDDAKSLLLEWQLRLKLNAGVKMDGGVTGSISKGYIVVLAFGEAELQVYRATVNNAAYSSGEGALKLAAKLRQEGVKVIAPAVDEFGGLCLAYIALAL